MNKIIYPNFRIFFLFCAFTIMALFSNEAISQNLLIEEENFSTFLNKAFKGENDDIDQNDTGYNEELRSNSFLKEYLEKETVNKFLNNANKLSSLERF